MSGLPWYGFLSSVCALGCRLSLTSYLDYDMCPTCYVTERHQHDVSHEFFAINEPGHVYVHTIFSGTGEKGGRNTGETHGARCTRVRRREPTVTTPAASTSPSASSTRVPALAEEVAHHASCDMCDSRIKGIRWVSACPHSTMFKGQEADKVCPDRNVSTVLTSTPARPASPSFLFSILDTPSSVSSSLKTSYITRTPMRRLHPLT